MLNRYRWGVGTLGPAAFRRPADSFHMARRTSLFFCMIRPATAHSLRQLFILWETSCSVKVAQLPTGRKQEQYLFGAQYCIRIHCLKIMTKSRMVGGGGWRFVILTLHHTYVVQLRPYWSQSASVSCDPQFHLVFVGWAVAKWPKPKYGKWTVKGEYFRKRGQMTFCL